MLTTSEDFNKHMAEHLDEIENMDIASLTNEDDVFECNLCSFESGLGDSLKEHMIEHINLTKQRETDNSIAETSKPKYQLLLDEYDDDGNYIGNDPRLMSESEESEESAETEEEDNEM